ncbi:signal peptidase I [Natrinema sp. 1APR25-10V2]|uniref:signal peptidase I n=1 Tax=Natrinema sp. 1APR25-10V2 TaxID=2951081 RepID=UPI002876522C|nr:signal peptidase I [Natrinema sp. 1APR25-10V2]MDS0475078.1 signal peptidase I [Natrinema sp. 1APR25-10V2]
MNGNARSVVYGVGGVLLLTMLVLVAVVTFPGVVGGDDAYIVTSDSMQPTISSGDVVVTTEVPADQIETGDVVTFHAGDDPDRGYITHRVIETREENGQLYFKTKGDANEDPDQGYVPASATAGVQHLHIPYLGYLLLFARSPLGLVALVVLPGVVLIASGCRQLLREFGYASVTGRVLDAILGSEETATVTDNPAGPTDSGVTESGDDR